MSDNLGDGLPDLLPGENLGASSEGGGDVTPPADENMLALILAQMSQLTVTVNALIGNNPVFYTPDYDISTANLVKDRYYRANTEIMRISIVGTGENYPSALTLTPVYVIFGPSGEDVPPELTLANSVLASVKNDNNTAVARLYVGRVRPGEGQAYLSLDDYSSGTKVKVWLFIDGREKLFIPASEFTAV